MDARLAVPAGPATRPLTAPVTSVTITRHRPNGADIRVTREATVWGLPPDTLAPASVTARRAP